MSTTLENLPIELTTSYIGYLLNMQYKCKNCTLGIVHNSDKQFAYVKCRRDTMWKITYATIRGDAKFRWIHQPKYTNPNVYSCDQPIKFPLVIEHDANNILCKHLICRQKHIKCSGCIHFIHKNFYSVYSLSCVNKRLNLIVRNLFKDELQIFFGNAK